MKPIRQAIFNVQKEMRVNGDSKELQHVLDLLCKIEKGEKINFVHSSTQFNACFKIGDEVWYNREKCTVLFIDEKTKLIDIEAEDSHIYIGTEARNITPRSV